MFSAGKRVRELEEQGRGVPDGWRHERVDHVEDGGKLPTGVDGWPVGRAAEKGERENG